MSSVTELTKSFSTNNVISTPDSHKALDNKINQLMDRLRDLKRFERMPITSELQDVITIISSDAKDISEAIKDLPSGKETLQRALEVCQKLIKIFAKNIEVIGNISEKPRSIYLPERFAEIAETIASVPIARKIPLQRGACGETTLIEHSDGTNYVIKHPIASSKESFLRERNIHYSFLPKIPGVVNFFGVNEEEDLLLEYLPGGDLLEIFTNPNLPIQTIFQIGQDVATALALLHKHLIHCDIKPENIMFDTNNKATVIDFDKARTHFSVEEYNLRFGSPSYIAPEMLTKGAPKDHKIDVWSLGCCLYKALSYGSSVYNDLGFMYDLSTPLEDLPFDNMASFLKDRADTIQTNISKLLTNLNLSKERPKEEKLLKILELSLKCDPTQRASMEEIAMIFNSSSSNTLI